MNSISHSPEDITLFKNKALQWAASFETACYFDSNSYADPYSAFDVLIAAGTETSINTSSSTAFEELHLFLQENKNWLIGFLGYDLKNAVENLQSNNPDGLKFPHLFFFKPKHLIKIKNGQVEVCSNSAFSIVTEIEGVYLDKTEIHFNRKIKSRYTESEYLQTVENIKEHIKRGDIYEMNLCQEFYAEDVIIDPLTVFKALNQLSPTPFSAFFKNDNKYIISATPERFLRKDGEKLISQPIKGTIKRSPDPEEDKKLKKHLADNSKERSENVMIVDLVRNDLTKCSVPGSVQVEELFGIYSFKQVHQMISTVASVVKPDLSNAEIIKEVFPMGSMTGAPKVKAMELIEKFERSKRGVFSGAVGYFSPEGNFDFNVIIRTILYNAIDKYLSFQVGSAITYASESQKEYEECLIKAEAILKVLGVHADQA